MNQSIKSFAKNMVAIFMATSCLSLPDQASAQSVIFPMQTQAGEAIGQTVGSNQYRLSNNLLEVTFLKSDGRLTFNGCPQLHLDAGTPIFSITLADGTEVSSDVMTLGQVELKTLTGQPDAAVASERLDGYAIEAILSYGDLDFLWQAILRDDSHYLRTSLRITARRGDVAMKSITPMYYSTPADNALRSVGNTRGSLLVSDDVFAGLETPTAYNTLETPVMETHEISADQGFSITSWSADTSGDTQPATPVYWTWSPGDTTPSAILSLGFSKDDIHGKRGFVRFTQSGAYRATFSYTRGTHGLNPVGVDLVDRMGKVVASDYHVGFTGSQSRNNTYTINVPQEGDYLLRYFVETRTETITSEGNVTWTPSVVAGSAFSAINSDDGFRLAGWIADTTGDTQPSQPAYWTWTPGIETPSGITALGFATSEIRGKRGFAEFAQGGVHTVTFRYTSGTHGLNVVGVDAVDQNGAVVASDYHIGFTGGQSRNNAYSLNIPKAGIYQIRYFVEIRTETCTSTGQISWSPTVAPADGFGASEGGNTASVCHIKGLWSRETTLSQGESWDVSSVVGIIALGQARRSFLCYSERERAVPWRAFPLYNSWYELNIDRNNSPTYDGHMTATMCEDVVRQWKTHLFDAYDCPISSFVWDDGWDEYGTWDFNKNFPNGFKEPYELTRQYNTGTGAWLGPVGGYGNSGQLRRQYWADKGGMVLSNTAYYNVFLGACRRMVNEYDFNFFKLDGISTQFSSVGPDAGATGNENAEGIISVLKAVRNIRPDMFFNVTVGTWASPFWFHYADAVWRQEGDWGNIGNQGDDREKWITYRDRLVYQNFVQNSPLCPINTLMTHGVILTSHGAVSKSMDYAGIVREMRCAFACGSGMVELYCDADLLNSINRGALWKDLADCIKWQKQNADVLPDIHWVGGNPWDGSKTNVYGWASWNGTKATLALRNPSATEVTYSFTLREALDIPAYNNDKIVLEKAFDNQPALSGLTQGVAIDPDTRISVSMPPSSVYVWNGVVNGAMSAIDKVSSDVNPMEEDEGPTYDLLGRIVDPRGCPSGLYIKSHTTVLKR